MLSDFEPGDILRSCRLIQPNGFKVSTNVTLEQGFQPRQTQK